MGSKWRCQDQWTTIARVRRNRGINEQHSILGDNLTVLREHIPDDSVDLIYLDPPFNSNASYKVLFKEKTGEESPAQIKTFTDA
jgi:16S rRNA G966 N2-methylase RsmD